MKPTPNASQNELVVLMPARNEARNLPASVQAVASSRVEGHDMTLLVCANACTDNTLEVLESIKARNKKMDYITETIPGKPHALNALIDKAEESTRMGANDVVLFLDADAKVQANTVSDLVGMLQKNRKLNAVSANDVSMAPQTQSVMDHLLFGVSEISLSSLALRDRKASCTAVRAKSVRGMRFPENVIADDLWLSMYLGTDTVETHPDAFVAVQAPKTFLGFAGARIRHLMGLYQLEDYFDAQEVHETIPRGVHEHVGALISEPELQDQFAQLPDVYKLGTILAVPLHAVFKAAAWVGYRMLPQPEQHVKAAQRAQAVKNKISSRAAVGM